METKGAKRSRTNGVCGGERDVFVRRDRAALVALTRLREARLERRTAIGRFAYGVKLAELSHRLAENK